MGRKTYKTAVVIIPPDEVFPPIEALRERHDRKFRRWMPHITLLYPFLSMTELDGIAPRLRNACKGVAPFEVELATFQIFEHSNRNCTLWLEPTPREPVIELQAVLWRMFPACEEIRRFAGGYIPHLSVGQARGERVARRLIAEWARHWKPHRFRVAQVCLIWRNDPPDDRFRVAMRIPLGQEWRGDR